MLPEIRIFLANSAPQNPQHPRVEVDVLRPYKTIGGGAFDHWSGAGNLLTAAYPETLNKWVAAGKDHEVASPAFVTGFALAINDPLDEWDVVIETATGGPAPHPEAIAVIPQGYILTGGGAFVEWMGAGNLLTASYPQGSCWIASGKDHIHPSPASITSYAIGISEA